MASKPAPGLRFIEIIPVRARLHWFTCSTFFVKMWLSATPALRVSSRANFALTLAVQP